MTKSEPTIPLGFKGVHSLELCVRKSKQWLDYFVKGFGFQYIASSNVERESETGVRTHTLRCADVCIVLLEPLNKTSYAGRFLSLHPEGIAFVNYEVEDLSLVEAELSAREAAFLDMPLTETVDGVTFKHVAVATPLGDVNFRFIQIDGDTDILPGQKRLAEFKSDYNPLGILGIDHLTSNVRTLQPLISWYERVLGLERFWNVEFHTEDLKPGTGTGLRSIVVWDPVSRRVKLANNEPLRPRFDESQIQVYVNDNRGPGVQHIAFLVKDIVSAVEYCNSSGNVNFLSTPHEYYEMVPARIKRQNMGKVDEPLELLERLNLLIDGEEGKYLLQIFCQDQAAQFGDPQAGPLFIEVIQRKGAESFGEGNFRALFESIERAQQGSKAS